LRYATASSVLLLKAAADAAYVSNKRVLHARGQFTIVYNPMTWYSAV